MLKSDLLNEVVLIKVAFPKSSNIKHFWKGDFIQVSIEILVQIYLIIYLEIKEL